MVHDLLGLHAFNGDIWQLVLLEIKVDLSRYDHSTLGKGRRAVSYVEGAALLVAWNYRLERFSAQIWRHITTSDNEGAV